MINRRSRIKCIVCRCGEIKVNLDFTQQPTFIMCIRRTKKEKGIGLLCSHYRVSRSSFRVSGKATSLYLYRRKFFFFCVLGGVHAHGLPGASHLTPDARFPRCSPRHTIRRRRHQQEVVFLRSRASRFALGIVFRPCASMATASSGMSHLFRCATAWRN